MPRSKTITMFHGKAFNENTHEYYALTHRKGQPMQIIDRLALRVVFADGQPMPDVIQVTVTESSLPPGVKKPAPGTKYDEFKP